MAGDCDDAGALAVLHAFADRGEADILAVITNRAWIAEPTKQHRYVSISGRADQVTDLIDDLMVPQARSSDGEMPTR